MKLECLTAALEVGEFGVWGGTSERERKKLRKRGGSAGICPKCQGVFTWHDTAFGGGRAYCGRCLAYLDVLQQQVAAATKAANAKRRGESRADRLRRRRAAERAATVTDPGRSLEDTA